MHLSSSGVKHLEEIKEAGYEMPSVNQIEVWMGSLPTPTLLDLPTISSRDLTASMSSPSSTPSANKLP